MPVKIVHANENGMVFLNCPFCEKVQRESAGKLPGNVPFKVDCPCGSSYECMVESRKVFRKILEFRMLISSIDPPGLTRTAIIKNLSLGGCGFQAPLNHGLQTGNIIQIRFKTGNVMKPIIWKEAIIRCVYDCYIGCEFLPTGKSVDIDFGFYFWQL